MTAPERIDICPDDITQEWSTPDGHPHMGPWVSYIRADLLDTAVNEALERAAVMVGTMQFPMQDSIDASVGLPPVGQRIAAAIRAMKKETGK